VEWRRLARFILNNCGREASKKTAATELTPSKKQGNEYEKENYFALSRSAGSWSPTRAQSRGDRFLNQYRRPGILLWPELLA
jgi:hypothetical protein